MKDREAWRAAVPGVTKSRTRLNEQQQEQKRLKKWYKREFSSLCTSSPWEDEASNVLNNKLQP